MTVFLMKTIITMLFVASMLTACGSGSWVEGEVAGYGIEVQSSAFYFNGTALIVRLSDSEDACADIRGAVEHKNGRKVELAVRDADPKLGTYVGNIEDGLAFMDAGAAFHVLDENCSLGTRVPNGDQPVGPATIEIVELEMIPGGRVRGAFEATLGIHGAPQSSIRGEFDAVFCEQPTTFIWPTCK